MSYSSSTTSSRSNTSPQESRARRPISPNRSGQDVYLRALQRFRPEVEVYFGHFLMHRVRAPLAQPLEGRCTVEVIKTEEKGSDVNLAVHLLNDGWLDAYDCSALPKKETVRKYRFANAVVASSRSEAARREPVPVAAVGIAPTLGSPKDYKLAVRVFKGHAALELLDAAEAAKAAAEEAAKRRPGESRVFDGMEFVWVPSGEFRMGSTSEEAHDSGWARGPQLPQGAFSIHRA